MAETAFKTRFELLQESGQVSQPAVDSAQSVIDAIEGHVHHQLTEDNAAMFVTHMVMAFERLMRHEQLNEVPQEVLDEVKEHPETREFVASTVSRVLEPYGVRIPDAEISYLALHLAAIEHAAD